MLVEGGGRGTTCFANVKQERDQLKEAVASFESELVQVSGEGSAWMGGWTDFNSFVYTLQIQNDAKMLAEDRDNFKLLYEQVYMCALVCHLTSTLSPHLTSRCERRLADFASPPECQLVRLQP